MGTRCQTHGTFLTQTTTPTSIRVLPLPQTKGPSQGASSTKKAKECSAYDFQNNILPVSPCPRTHVSSSVLRFCFPSVPGFEISPCFSTDLTTQGLQNFRRLVRQWREIHIVPLSSCSLLHCSFTGTGAEVGPSPSRFFTSGL